MTLEELHNSLSKTEYLYKYEVIKSINNEGNFGSLWLARDLTTDRVVAIKVMEVHNLGLSSTFDESKFGNRFDHVNLVKVHSADVVPFETSTLLILVMDYLPKGSISSNLNRMGFLNCRKLKEIAEDVLRALEHLHTHNVIHNDIKPNNILLDENSHAKLTDYGISANLNSDGTGLAPNSYKLHRAPETDVTSLISVKSDIFQLGMTLFRLCCGDNNLSERFFKLGEDEYYSQINSGNLIKESDFPEFIPTCFKKIILRAIDNSPEKRFSSALEMRRELEKILLPGHWDFVDDKFVGETRGYLFYFEIEPVSLKRSSIVAYKTNKASNRTTRIAQFCLKDGTKSEIEKLKKNFFKFVLNGGK